MTEPAKAKSEWAFTYKTAIKSEVAPEKKPFREATQKEILNLRELTSKAVNDVMTATGTTMELAGDVAGPAGIWVVSQRIMGMMAMGSAMALHALRTQDTPTSMKKCEDDLLYCCLLAYTADSADKDQKQGGEYMKKARELFQKLTGREFVIPPEWESMINRPKG